MRRRLLPIAIFAGITVVLAAACGGDDGPDAPPATPTPNFTSVTSDDGKLTLQIPLGAIGDDVEISITMVPLAELPEPLKNVRGAGTGYKLEPDGLEFSEPVTAILELDRSELDPEDEGSVTAYALVTQTADGELEVLPEQSLEWTLGEETVISRGELRHFSWITRTKGSLTVRLEEVDREQPVAATFRATGVALNSDDSGSITIVDATLDFQAFGTVSQTGITTISDSSVLTYAQLATVNTQKIGAFECGDEAGIGSYGVIGAGTSVRMLPDLRVIRTNLRVVVDSVVECVAADAPTATPVTFEESTPPPPAGPTSTPTPSATAPPSSGASLAISCEHTRPGISSELIVRVSGLAPGQPIVGEASGSGLKGGPTTLISEANGEGKVEFRITIFEFGAYQVNFKSEGLSGSYTVGDVCPG